MYNAFVKLQSMEFQYISVVISAFLFGIFVFRFFTSQKRDRKAPEVAGAWPVLGHLHLLGGSNLFHRYLASLADIYGPVFTIRLGLQQAVVVSDSELAKQCFTTNDKVFANRPKTLAADIMGYNYANFGFASSGPYWSEVRKTVVHELLSDRRLRMLSHIRVSEVKEYIKDTYLFWLNNKKNTTGHVKIEDMKEWLGSLLLNIVLKMIVGKRFSNEEGEEARRQKAVIKRFFMLLGSFVVSDYVPFLRFLDLGGYKKKMKNIATELDQIVEGWLTEHRASRSTRSGDENYEDRDFMDVMLSTIDKNPNDFGSFDADTIIKSTCGALLIAGTDTTIQAITWALALLLNNPDVLERARREVDEIVGKEREVEESDVKNLVYLHAIMKEALRLYGGGIIFAHESMESCNLGGYDIPKGTLLMVNIWKIHRDPETWLDPLKFEPERFLTTHQDVDIRGQHFELLPFGSGRRMCPGVSFALQVAELVLARLIHSFDLSPPTDEPIDMTECLAVTLGRATPLQVLLKPRLSTSIYL